MEKAKNQEYNGEHNFKVKAKKIEDGKFYEMNIVSPKFQVFTQEKMKLWVEGWGYTQAEILDVKPI